MHSLGGLVAKKAIYISSCSAEDHEQQLHRRVMAIAFLGTPHHGSNLAPYGTMVTQIFKATGLAANVEIVRLLQRDSEALSEIEAGFSTWLLSNRERFKLTCFYEEREVTGVGMVCRVLMALAIPSYPCEARGRCRAPKLTFPIQNRLSQRSRPRLGGFRSYPSLEIIWYVSFCTLLPCSQFADLVVGYRSVQNV